MNLTKYDAACAALAEARSIDEVKDIHDRAEAMRAYARMANDVRLETDAAEIRIRSERRLGILLAQQKIDIGLNQGGRPPADKTGDNVLPVSPPTLAEIGIDKRLSAKSQRLAELDEGYFEGLVGMLRARILAHRGKVSLDILRDEGKAAARAAHQARTSAGGTAADLATLRDTGFRAGTILADPPWHFMTRSAKGEGRSASQHYTTNGIDEIKALPVAELAAENSILLMWMVDWCPAAALEVMAAWGFEHKTTAFTWAKQNKSGEEFFMGQGYWTRANPESCWLGTRGSPMRLNADVRQLVVAPIMEHSRKPDIFYDLIERLVGGPYLELYARRPRPGWISWGNEIEAPGANALPAHDPETGEIIDEKTFPVQGGSIDPAQLGLHS